MNGKFTRLLRHGLVGALVLAGLGAGLQGCYRGMWHDSAYMDRNLTWIQEDVAESLNLRADQKPAFDALMNDVRTFARARAQTGRDTMLQLKAEFDKPKADVEHVKAIVKEQIRQRANEAELNALVDKMAGFYASLDAEQQATLNKRIARHLDRASWFGHGPGFGRGMSYGPGAGNGPGAGYGAGYGPGMGYGSRAGYGAGNGPTPAQ